MLTKENYTNLSLPNEVTELRLMLLSFQEKAKNYEEEIKLLREKICSLQHQLYSRKSEKYVLNDDFSQKPLFADDEKKNSEIETEPENVVTVPEHKRKKKGRKPLPKDIDRIEIVHDLTEEEQTCQCGCKMSKIGEASSEKLEIQPPQFWIIRNIRPKYACKKCEGLETNESPVKIAPVPVQILPKSIATPSLLAHILVSKFQNAMPFYRQEKQLLGYGIKLNRATICNWTFKISDKLKILSKMLKKELLDGSFISIDETTVQVLKESSRSASSKSHMWVFRGGPPGKKIVLFRYSPSRSGDVARKFIGNYQGYVQTDGYAGYDFLDASKGIIHVGCWAHARRKFVKVLKSYNKNSKNIGGKGKSGFALQMIRQLYMIERKARESNLSSQELYQLRQEEAKPILDKFEEWLKDNAVKIPPSGQLGEAFNYTINQWSRLSNYIKSGLVPIDNNLTENAIRPFVIGRKNWLFSDQPDGAHASALFYSLIETAKANGLEPYSYFLYLFDRFPHAVNENDYKKLLPTYVTQATLDDAKKEYWQELENQKKAT